MAMSMGQVESGEYPPYPVPRECPFAKSEPAPAPDDRQAVSRVTLPTGATSWLVTGYDLVREALADPRVSVDPFKAGYPHLNPFPVAEVPTSKRSMLGLDPPEHTARRRVFINEFTVRRMHLLRPRIQEIVDACIDELLSSGRPADLVQAVSYPVPSMAFCELFGIPYEDRDFFVSHLKTLLDRNSSAADMKARVLGLFDYFDRLLRTKEEDPGDDLLGRAIVKYRDQGTYDHDYMVQTGTLFVNAAHGTVANMISLSVVALLENPAQLAEIRADPGLTPQAVEELLRYFTVVDTMRRVAVADIEIGGQKIRAGEGLIALLGAANMDEQFFADPARLDIHRDEVRHHVTFSHGNHNCIGQNLARVELEVVLNTLFTRLPGLRLSKPAAELSYKDTDHIYGIHEVPVTW
jgi:cytochrome P450